MRILWFSNSPWSFTGYGNQTELFAPKLKELGHEVAIASSFGLDGGMLHWNGIPVYPKAHHMYGLDIVAQHANNWQADIVISLIDTWIMNADVFRPFKWIPWFPIDMEPLPRAIFDAVNGAYDRIPISKFGEKMLKNAGLGCRYVPHGVDTKLFAPGDMKEARRRLGLPQDKYIVGMVAANNGFPSRKAFHPQLAAFAEFKKQHEDAILYMHTELAMSGENHGVNMVELCQAVGLKLGTDVIFADQYFNKVGFPGNYMVDLYNSLDVHMLVSMGEGFGIPILEAQACGCPVIVGDWTSMSELCFSGWKVKKTEADPWFTPLSSYQFAPRIDAIADRLEKAYVMRGNPEYRSRARDGALAYDADKITEKYWKPVLETIAGNL